MSSYIYVTTKHMFTKKEKSPEKYVPAPRLDHSPATVSSKNAEFMIRSNLCFPT